MRKPDDTSAEADARAERSAQKVQVQGDKVAKMRLDDPARRQEQVVLGAMMRNASMADFSRLLAHGHDDDERRNAHTRRKPNG